MLHWLAWLLLLLHTALVMDGIYRREMTSVQPALLLLPAFARTRLTICRPQRLAGWGGRGHERGGGRVVAQERLALSGTEPGGGL